MTPRVRIEDRGAVRILTIDNPAKRNALDFRALDELEPGVVAVDVEERVVALNGALERLLADPRPGTHLDYAPADEVAVAVALLWVVPDRRIERNLHDSELPGEKTLATLRRARRGHGRQAAGRYLYEIDALAKDAGCASP